MKQAFFFFLFGSQYLQSVEILQAFDLRYNSQ